MLQKHRLQSLAELIELKSSLADSLAAVQSSGEQLDQLRAQAQKDAAELQKQALDISQKRATVLPGLAKAINALLPDMGMVHARFHIEHKTSEQRHPRTGIDQLRFYSRQTRAVRPRKSIR